MPEDVGDVVGHRRRVDGGGGGARRHDRKVGEDPLVASTRGDPDPLLGPDAERDEAGRDLGDMVARLPPGQRLPALADWEPVGLTVRRRGDSVEEHPADRLRPAVESRLNLRGVRHKDEP